MNVRFLVLLCAAAMGSFCVHEWTIQLREMADEQESLTHMVLQIGNNQHSYIDLLKQQEIEINSLKYRIYKLELQQKDSPGP